MTDRQRWLIYGSLGAIALMVVGADELLRAARAPSPGWRSSACSGWLIFNTWREAQSI